MSLIDAYPTARVDDLIDSLVMAKFLDLSREYWQIEMGLEDQHKTAFTTPFEFTRTGCHLVFKELQHMIYRYLDELFTKTWMEHL